MGTNRGGGGVSGTATVAVASGVATFPGLSINRSGAGYTLTASSGSLSTATSTAFDVAPGTATRVTFTVQPTGTTAGSVLTPAIQVTALDALGNTATGFTGDVSVAIGTNPGTATLSGTSTKPAALRVATFGDLSLDKAGVGYTLTAGGTGLAGGATSVGVQIPGPAADPLPLARSTAPASPAA